MATSHRLVYSPKDVPANINRYSRSADIRLSVHGWPDRPSQFQSTGPCLHTHWQKTPIRSPKMPTVRSQIHSPTAPKKFGCPKGLTEHVAGNPDIGNGERRLRKVARPPTLIACR